MAASAFSPRSIWNTKLTDDVPIIGSGSYAPGLIKQILMTTSSTPIHGYYNPPYTVSVNQNTYSAPVWVVDSSVAEKKVTYKQNGSPVGSSDPLQQAFNSVPLPSPGTGLASAGSDASCVVWRQSTDELWEFFGYTDTDSTLPTPGPSATWGGYIPHVSRSPGYYAGSPETNNLSWGCRASGFSVLGGLMRLDEIAAGVIPHGLVCAIPGQSGTLSPAQRSDGPGPNILGSGVVAAYVPEGSLFRFPPGGTPSNLSVGAQLLYNAIRDYGLYVGDGGSNFEICIEDSRPPTTQYTDSVSTTNPSNTPNSSDVLSLPWSGLEQVQWISPIPTGKKLAFYQNQISIFHAF
jgi:hypothetical protein